MIARSQDCCSHVLCTQSFHRTFELFVLNGLSVNWQTETFIEEFFWNSSIHCDINTFEVHIASQAVPVLSSVTVFLYSKAEMYKNYSDAVPAFSETVSWDDFTVADGKVEFLLTPPPPPFEVLA